MMRVRNIVSLTIFSAPLMFFSNGSISAFKILAIILLLLLVHERFKYKHYSLVGIGPFWPFIVGFLAYNVVIQIMFGLFGAMAYSGYESMDSSKPLTRLGVQLLSFMLIVALTVYIYRYGRQKPSVVIKPVIIVLKLLLLVSGYELASIYIGLPKVPLYFGGAGSEVSQNFSNFLDPTRIHSLAGEPRFYAVVLAVAFNAALFFFAHSYGKLTTRAKLKYALFLPYTFILLLCTQSTSGIIALVLLLPFTFVLSKGISFGNKTKMVGFLVGINLVLYPVIADLVQTRVVDRIRDEMLSDNHLNTADAAYVDVPILGLISFDATDATPLVLLLDKPFLAITGVGYGNISTYVKPYLPDYSGYWGYGFQGIVEPNLAWLKSILSYGVIGNLILVILYWKFLKHYRAYGHLYNNMLLLSFYTSTSVFWCAYFLTSPMLVLVWFFAFHAAILERYSATRIFFR